MSQRRRPRRRRAGSSREPSGEAGSASKNAQTKNAQAENAQTKNAQAENAQTKNAQTLRRLRDLAIERGLCGVCRCRAPRVGVRTCDECLDRSMRHRKTRRGRAARVRYLRRKYAQRRASGACVRCGRPAQPSYARCASCLDQAIRRAQARRRAAGVPPRDGRCSICGERGHQRSRHVREAQIGATEPGPRGRRSGRRRSSRGSGRRRPR